MARTDFEYFKGKTKWFRSMTPNEWGRWNHILYLDNDSLDRFKKLQEPTETSEGIKNVLQKDDDGYFINLSRPAQREYKGKVTAMLPPLVTDGSRTLPDGSNPPLKDLVGNGSDVVSKVEIYTYNIPARKGKRGKAIRWLSTRVDNLIPYSGRTDLNEVEERAVKGLDEQAPQKEYHF